MENLPKPKKCDQNWFDMKPIQGGRLCGQCTKKIVDFTKLSWKEIAEIQTQNNNSICGVYNLKQLEHWGHEVPNSGSLLIKGVAISGLLFAAINNNYSQTKITDEKLVITGRVFEKETGENMIGATIRIEELGIGMTSDIHGKFQIESTTSKGFNKIGFIEITYTGMEKVRIGIKEINDTTLNNIVDGCLNVAMRPDTSFSGFTGFYAYKPTRWQRFKSKISRFFK